MPPSIRRAHCDLEGMKANPPKARTLRRKAQAKNKNKHGLKDVVIKVHKVPKDAPVFDRRSPVERPAPESRKRKLEPTTTTNESPKKKIKIQDVPVTTPSLPASRKRKADSQVEDAEQAPIEKKQKLEVQTPSTTTEITTPPPPATSVFQDVKDDGTHRTCFLDLPPEIRNDIYHLAMDDRLNLNPRQAWGNEHPILKTCKQIRSESSLLFHNKTQFQTNKSKFAYAFIKSRSTEQKANLSSVRIAPVGQTRPTEQTLHKIRRTLHGFKRTFHRKGLDDSVIQMQMPVYDPDKDEIEDHWVSANEVGLYTTMEGHRRNNMGAMVYLKVVVLRPTDEPE